MTNSTINASSRMPAQEFEDRIALRRELEDAAAAHWAAHPMPPSPDVEDSNELPSFATVYKRNPVRFCVGILMCVVAWSAASVAMLMVFLP